MQSAPTAPTAPTAQSAQTICFITAIFGILYKASECLPFRQQTVATDFICFTDNKDIVSNGWHIDTKQYHDDNVDSARIVKYYKMKWHEIPILKHYDIIVWIDSNIEIISPYTSQIIIQKLQKNKILCWYHPLRCGRLQLDAYISSRLHKYKDQDILSQYHSYIDDAYYDDYFKCLNKLYANEDNDENHDYLGVWLTNFIAFLAKDTRVIQFILEWYGEILKHSTQDRISFSYICFKKDMIPYTLPDKEIFGIAHMSTQFYIIHDESGKT